MDTPNAAADEGPGYSSWRPEILNTAVLMDRMRVQYLQHEVTRPILVYDTIGEQLRDLAKLVNPSKKFNDEALDVELTRTRAGPESAAYGRWIYYPWSRRL